MSREQEKDRGWLAIFALIFIPLAALAQPFIKIAKRLKGETYDG